MRSAKFLTALDYVGLILLKIPSAARRISAPRSSLPMPSGLATELILPKIEISLARFSEYSGVPTTILPRAFSFCSIYASILSLSIASVMKRLASASISISSKT